MTFTTEPVQCVNTLSICAWRESFCGRSAPAEAIVKVDLTIFTCPSTRAGACVRVVSIFADALMRAR
jgi:hypothetical protein